MSFIVKTSSTKVLDIRITDKGRELLTKGLKDQDTFDIVKFSFGDSEIDYGVVDQVVLADGDAGDLASTLACWAENDLKNKLYYIGTIPSGQATVILSKTSLDLQKFGQETILVSSKWFPVINDYAENYKWTNLGPLKDWQFSIDMAPNTKSANIQAFDITGSTKIKIVGLTTGKYAILKVNIT